MSLLKVNEIQIFNGTTVTITATTAEVSADLNVGADLDVTGALTLGTALAVAEGGTGATDAATARTNLDVDQAGTDNSTDVTLVTTSHDYLSIAGQAITLGPIDLATDVTGNLPYASISGTPTLGTAAAEDVGYFATAAQGALADSAVQPGDNANTLGSGAATDGYVLTADGAGNAAWEAASGASLPIDLLSSGASIRKSDGTTAVLSESGGVVTLENASLGDTVLMPDNSNNVSTAPGIRFEADTDTGIGLASAGNLAVVTGGSERMRIDSSGNVGIGTSSTVTSDFFSSVPRAVIENAGNIALRLSSTNTASGVGVAGLSFAANDGGSGQKDIAIIRAETAATNAGAGVLQFYTRPSGGTNTERMRIDSSGRVGIGTSDPTTPIEQFSSSANGIAIAAANAPLLSLVDTTDFTNYIFWVAQGNADTYLWNKSGAMRFGTSSTERMRIDSNGNVLIGYTSSNGSYKLQVNSQIFATSAIIATSDGRYKENVTSLDGALNLVAQLNPVQFTWKEHPVHDFDRTQPTVGFIAQEVQEVLKDTPYVNSIIKANECLVGEEKDEEGNIITEGTTEEFLGIAEGNLIALLTKALQEANAKIDALETRIQALEA